MNQETSAVAAGWGKPIPYSPQLVLFGNERDVVLAAAFVSLDDMVRWHQNGWISYDATRVDDLDEAQHVEMFFVRDIARSGLSNAVITRMLSELPRPYAYSPERVAYSFHFGWVQLPYPLSMDEMMTSHLSQWLDEQIHDGNLERLKEILEQITEALEDCN
jgi:hypothetical protein